MMERNLGDKLREEYANLRPIANRRYTRLFARVSHVLEERFTDRRPHEIIHVVGRVKECESALSRVLRNQEGRLLDPAREAEYSLTTLVDLIGLRVLVFPRDLLESVNEHLRAEFPDWNEDHYTGALVNGQPLVYKYSSVVAPGVSAEYQVLSPLLDGFWNVEHAVLYKPQDDIRDLVDDPRMKDSYLDVLRSLVGFEERVVEVLGG